MIQKFRDTSPEQIDEVMVFAEKASWKYRTCSLKQRADFMRAIAEELGNDGGDLVATAMTETNLPQGRLESEKTRTIFQLTSYAEACEKGDWMHVTIDRGDKNTTPVTPDIRKMMVPLGPVVVFGASNFPFAYSTAGGDTACAFAAGCPVIVKAHPAHANTSQKVADLIIKAAKKSGMPEGIFSHVHGAGIETGKQLVQHRFTKAVGFTGSLAGGRQLFDWGNQRKDPIPVFAEMGSVNPVFILPEKLKQNPVEIAEMYAGSVTLSVGQFCTNPGLIIGIAGDSLDKFSEALGNKIREIEPATMLHPGIAKSFNEKMAMALQQSNVRKISESKIKAQDNQGAATIATTTGEIFLKNPLLHEEVFGPYSLVVSCKDETEMLAVARQIKGQLTSTLMATVEDTRKNQPLVEAIKNICGRIVMNGVPTGVQVCLSMQHGGPYPATTDSRFTAVGADGIKRFARPVAFQNWPDELLPEELKDENPLKLWRTVNSKIMPPMD